MNSFKVINWHAGKIQYLDVMPYFIDEYKREKRKSATFEEFKNFIKQKGMYRFWSRCEYEVIVSNWPPGKEEVKVDVWDQIEQNIDLVTELLIKSVLLK